MEECEWEAGLNTGFERLMCFGVVEVEDPRFSAAVFDPVRERVKGLLIIYKSYG